MLSVAFIAVDVSYGVGRHADTVPLEDLRHATLFTMMTSTLGISSFAIPKFAVLILLVKIVNPGPRHKVLMWCISIVYSLLSIGTIVIIWAQCTPTAVQWGEANVTCWDPRILYVFGLVHGIFSAVFDFYLAVYPSVIMASMYYMNWRKKLALSSALGFGYW